MDKLVKHTRQLFTACCTLLGHFFSAKRRSAMTASSPRLALGKGNFLPTWINFDRKLSGQWRPRKCIPCGGVPSQQKFILHAARFVCVTAAKLWAGWGKNCTNTMHVHNFYVYNICRSLQALFGSDAPSTFVHARTVLSS